MSEEKFLSEIFEHMVVNPRVSLDDFEDYDECQEVANAAVEFQHGGTIPQ
jgi:hypothetical protein